jgi:hypothetical protein
MTYKLFAEVFTARTSFEHLGDPNDDISLHGDDRAVPLATLVSAGEDPTSDKGPGSHPAILGPNGRKR